MFPSDGWSERDCGPERTLGPWRLSDRQSRYPLRRRFPVNVKVAPEHPGKAPPRRRDHRPGRGRVAAGIPTWVTFLR